MPLSIAQIARQHDVTAATVRNWIDPGLQVLDPEGDTSTSTAASLPARTTGATGGSNKPTSMPSSKEKRGNLS